MNWNQATFPSLKRRGGCGSIKGAKPPISRRRGGRFGEIFRPEQFRRTDHPGRAVSERIHFIDSAATPPFQGGECRALQFVHTFSVFAAIETNRRERKGNDAASGDLLGRT